MTLSSTQLHQDGVHICGPARDVTIKHIRGYTGDDLVGITARDTTTTGNDYTVYGTVQGVLVDDVSGASNGSHSVTVISAPASPVYDVTVRHAHGSALGSPGGSTLTNGVLIADNNFYSAAGGWTGAQGLVSNIVVDDVSDSRTSAVIVQTTNGGDITLRNLSATINHTGTGSSIVSVNEGGSGATVINNLRVSGLVGNNMVSAQIFNEAAGATIGQLSIENVQYSNISSGGAYVAVLVSGTVKDYILRNVQLNYNTTLTNVQVTNVAPTGVVTNMSVVDFHITYQTGSTKAGEIVGIFGAVSSLTMEDVTDVAPSASVMSDTFLYIGSGATLGAYNINNLFGYYISGCLSNSGTLGVGSISNATQIGMSTPCINSQSSMQATTIAGSGASTFTANSGAGTSPGTPACVAAHTCDSYSGVVQLTMGTSTTSGNVMTVNFPSAKAKYGNCYTSMYLVASPYTQVAVRGTYSVSSVTFTAGTAPTASTNYEFVYVCPGN